MKRGTIEHPKTLMLANELACRRYAAVGILECLWHFTARYAPQGDVGKYTDEVIAEALGWDEDAHKMVAALKNCGWLEDDEKHRLIVHDWSHHADDAVNKHLDRCKLRFIDGAKPYDKGATKSRRRRDKGAKAACLPEPCLALPEPKPTPLKHNYLGNEKFNGLWVSFLDMRKSIKAKPTARAIELLLAKLHAHPIEVACGMLEASIENSWRGLFPPKERGNGSNKRSVVESWAEKRGIDIHANDEPGIENFGRSIPQLEAHRGKG